MPPKRRYNNARRKTAKKYGVKAKVANASASKIQAVVRRMLNKQIETKNAVLSSSDYQQISHNNFIALESGSLLGMTQGVQDNNVSNSQVRIGDEITLKGVAIRMMLELNERYSDVSYRILCVKHAKGDTPTKATLFNGLSGNKMLDTIDRERYSILYEKWGKIKNDTMSGGAGASQDSSIAEPSTGIYKGFNIYTFSRVTKIVKFWLPAKKLQQKVVKYENNSGQVKFFDYSILIYAYSNFTTSEVLGYNVLAVNDYVKQIYFQDA